MKKQYKFNYVYESDLNTYNSHVKTYITSENIKKYKDAVKELQTRNEHVIYILDYTEIKTYKTKTVEKFTYVTTIENLRKQIGVTALKCFDLDHIIDVYDLNNPIHAKNIYNIDTALRYARKKVDGSVMSIETESDRDNLQRRFGHGGII